MLSLFGGVLSKLYVYHSDNRHALLSLICTFCLFTHGVCIGDVLWGVNCGGGAHVDVHGIRYQADYLKYGIPSDFGKNLPIQRVAQQDQILYQTERYHVSTFGYDIPLKGDGDYVLVVKFAEVWFTAPNQKVFDVVLNGEHTVVSELDIYSKAGRGVAHDEVIPFSIAGGKLKVNGESSIMNGKLSVEFLKGEYDNPKVNAMYLMKGTVEDVPMLPQLPGADISKEEEEEEEEERVVETKGPKSRNPSGPKVIDPYASDDTSTMLFPIIIAIGAFIPLLFCLCKL